jgi:GNAT superfamily N-acetyltransferase
VEIRLKLDPDEADMKAVRDGLIDYNRLASPREANWKPVAIHLIDDSGKAVGGLTGAAVFDWLFIQLLHIPESLRGQGYGSKLMARAEAFAREHGCVGVWLDTFDFQARPFYEKLGYTVFGTLEDHPLGGARYFLSKRLD